MLENILETICCEIFGNYMLGNFWKLYAGKFFGNYMLGNFLETICWEILSSI